MPKYIEFQEVMPHPNGIWVIRNKRSGDILGRVEWYARWRLYVAIFSDSTVWSHDCLADVSAFMRSLSNKAEAVKAKGPSEGPTPNNRLTGGSTVAGETYRATTGSATGSFPNASKNLPDEPAERRG
jgi:hypothetical protein